MSYRVMKSNHPAASKVSLLMLALKLVQSDLCQNACKPFLDGMLLSLLACPLDPQRMEDERRKRTVSPGATISCSLQKSCINASRALMAPRCFSSCSLLLFSNYRPISVRHTFSFAQHTCSFSFLSYFIPHMSILARTLKIGWLAGSRRKKKSNELTFFNWLILSDE